MANIPISIAHRLWDCRIACRARNFSIGIINTMKGKWDINAHETPYLVAWDIWEKHSITSEQSFTDLASFERYHTLEHFGGKK